MPITPRDRFTSIKAAFAGDGFVTRPVPDPFNPGKNLDFVELEGRIGVMAENPDAVNTVTKLPKKAYYVEGSNKQMGFLLGVMAEPEISRMATDFVENVVFSFVKMAKEKEDESASGDAPAEKPKRETKLEKELKELIVRIVYEISQETMKDDIPKEYVEELRALYEGCRTVNPETKVEWDHLWGLNYGIDCLIAHVYTGTLFRDKGVRARMMNVPIMCNAFTVSGEAAAGGKCFFGRDFMFPTADVYQDMACMIVQKPDSVDGRERKLFVSQTAPGILGSMAAMNEDGVAIGVDMCPSMLCDPKAPGFNTLGLNRDVVQYSADAKSAVDRIVATKRGVSWLYPLADASGRCCMLETGKYIPDGEKFPYYEYVPKHYKRSLPNLAYIEEKREKYHTPEPKNGTFARWNGYEYPVDFVKDYDKKLWKAYNNDFLAGIVGFFGGVSQAFSKLFSGRSSLAEFVSDLGSSFFRWVKYSDGYFGEREFVDSDLKERNCPGPFYFAPQRETRGEVTLVTNHFLSPEMRLVAMNDWVAVMTGSIQDDTQFRYDALNFSMANALDFMPEGIDETQAWRLINFLTPAPGGNYRQYWNPSLSDEWRTMQVYGSVSLCELTGKKMTSLFGYYGDKPVTINLLRYK
jgi:hypothetical protein